MQAVRAYLVGLQDRITQALEAADGGAGFREDDWRRSEGGGGRSRILEGGTLFEKAGVGYSHVHGPGLPASATAQRPELAGRGFEGATEALYYEVRPWNIKVSMVQPGFIHSEAGFE